MKYMLHTAHPNRDDRAQGLVEFAIILPLMLFIVFGVVEITRILQSWILLENGVREGASYASSKVFNPVYCPEGDCDTSEEIIEATIRSVQDIIWEGSRGVTREPEGEANPDQEYFYQSVVCLRKNLIHPTSPRDTYHCQPEDVETWEGEYVVLILEYNHAFIVPMFFMKDPFLRMTARRDVIIREQGSLPPGDG
jgi:hypothetical protein